MSKWRPHPVLLILNAEQEPRRRYICELLIQEGYFSVDSLEMAAEDTLGDQLEGRALAIVSADGLSSRACLDIADYLRAGGSVIMIAPPATLIESVGLDSDMSTLHGYSRIDRCYAHFTDDELAAPHAGAIVQCVAAIKLWKAPDERVLAWAGSRKDETSSYPLVSLQNCGQGLAAIFRFDVGTNAMLLRQGDCRYATTGPMGIPDRAVGYKPAALFAGLLDPELRDVPQADVWADLFVSLIRHLTDEHLPLPRIWHFPNNSPALTLLDGDSDGYDWDSYHAIADPAMKAGIPYTLNLMPKHLCALDRVAADALLAQGHDFALHHEADSATPSVASSSRTLYEQANLFAEIMGRPSMTIRAHTLMWPGYTEMAKAYATAGLRLETNFMPFVGYQFGYLGSARAARFMTGDGQFIDVSQQPTTFMDDPMSNEKSLLPARTPDRAYGIVMELYEQSVNRFHGAICTCLHPVADRKRYHDYILVQNAMCQAVADATARWKLTALTQRAWSEFHEARRVLDMRWENGAWILEARSSIRGCTALSPAGSGTNRQGSLWRSVACDLQAGEEKMF